MLTNLETLTECPICGCNEFNPFLTCKDYLISHTEFTIQQCRQCAFRLTNPRPDSSSIGAYYASDQYVSHNDKGNGLMNGAYRLVRSYTLQQKLILLNKLNGKPGQLLDVGCGTGTFLETCQRGGWQVTGMEPDDNARSLSAGRIKQPIAATLTDVPDSNGFDIITLWHVLEHIPALNESLQIIRMLLKGTGRLLIAVPNCDSYDANYYKQYWAAYDLPRHLYHFTPSTMKTLLKQSGFSLIEMRPMMFDAFYIAMLSSRYMTGQTNYIESLKVGLLSNTKSERLVNTSSVLYIISKEL